MVKFNDKLPIKGEFEAWEVWPDGTRTLLYTDANQIQYIGANLLATALAIPTATMPRLAGIATTAVPATSPPSGKPIKRSDTVDFLAAGSYQVAAGFVATPSSALTEQQVVISRGSFAGYSGAGKYYEFCLVFDTITDDNSLVPLTYKFVDGGLSWGIGANLEIVWTLFFGIT